MRNLSKYPMFMDKSYQNAIEILDSSRRVQRPSIQAAENISGLNETRSPNEGDLKGKPSISGMREWLDRLGHSAASIDRLNVIHVAGTKGKGSTCAFIDSFLRAYGNRTGFPQKIGLYTSPHLVDPEERIRINFKPLSRALFAKYFFEVDGILSDKKIHDPNGKPRYLQLFALLSFHAFISEGVDAAIYETHHGGEYDSTNVIQKPIVTAITSLGLDHMKQLGSSIESIAWHKAGIFKPGSAAVSAPQEPIAAETLRQRALEKGVSIHFVDKKSCLEDPVRQIEPAVLRTNCSVALAAVRCFVDSTTKYNRSQLTSSDVLQGISEFSLPGRFQSVIENQFQWFLDGAHNEMSATVVAEWFLDRCKRLEPTVPRILIFSLITEQRDGVSVFQRLATSLAYKGIDYAIFSTYDRHQDLNFNDVTNPLQSPFKDGQTYAKILQETQPDTEIIFQSSIQGALNVARKIGIENGGMQTLITGSQHLVGGALSLLKTPQNENNR